MVSEIPLQIFGPQTFYQWLFQQWEDLDSGSQDALRQLFAHQQGIPPLDLGTLPQSRPTWGEAQWINWVTALEYERALTALTDGDFIQFVEWALDINKSKAPWPYGWEQPVAPPGLDDLVISHQELREQLLLTFSREQIWPQQGPYLLIREALGAARQAVETLTLAGPNVSLLKRRDAARLVHDGVDRALLCAERVLDLLIEFFALLLLNQEGPLSPSLEEAEDWLVAAGVKALQDGKRPPWHKKQKILSNEIGKHFEGNSELGVPEGLETVWEDLYALAVACRMEQDDQGKWQPTGDLMRIFDALRDHRNAVRHAPYPPLGGHQVPANYAKAALPIYELLLRLERLTSQLGRRHYAETEEAIQIPQIVKILKQSGDCYGGVSFTLALETGFLIEAQYVHMADAALLAKHAEESLALSQEEYEFFLFPPSGSEQQVLVNPLLLRRNYTPRHLGSVELRPEFFEQVEAAREEFEEKDLEEEIGLA